MEAKLQSIRKCIGGESVQTDIPQSDDVIAFNVLSITNMLCNGIGVQKPAKTLQTAEELLEWLKSLHEPQLGFSIRMAEKRLTVVYTGNKAPRPNPPLPKRFERQNIGKRIDFEEDKISVCRRLVNPPEEWLGFVPVFKKDKDGNESVDHNGKKIRLVHQWTLADCAIGLVPDRSILKRKSAGPTVHSHKLIRLEFDDGAAASMPPSAVVDTHEVIDDGAAVLVPPSLVSPDTWAFLCFHDGKRIPVTTNPFRIGREETGNEHWFRNADQTTQERVSRQHCSISRPDKQGNAILYDTSTNGTWMGDIRVAKKTNTELCGGAIVHLHKREGVVSSLSTSFTFELNTS